MSQVALTPVVLYSHALSLATPPVQAGAAREACEHFFRETLNPKLREMFVPEMSRLGRVPRVTACLDARPDVTVTCVNTLGPSQLVLTSARRPLRFREAPRLLTVSQVFSEEAQRFVQFFAQTVKPCFLGFQTLVFDRTFFFPAPSRGNPGVSRADSKHLAFVSNCVRSSVYLLLSISPRFGRARVGVHDFNPVSFQPPPHFAIFYIQVWVKDAPLNQRLTSPEVHV